MYWLPPARVLYPAAPKKGSGVAKLKPKCSQLVHRLHLIPRPSLPLRSEAREFFGVSRETSLLLHLPLGKQHNLFQKSKKINGRSAFQYARSLEATDGHRCTRRPQEKLTQRPVGLNQWITGHHFRGFSTKQRVRIGET